MKDFDFNLLCGEKALEFYDLKINSPLEQAFIGYYVLENGIFNFENDFFDIIYSLEDYISTLSRKLHKGNKDVKKIY